MRHEPSRSRRRPHCRHRCSRRRRYHLAASAGWRGCICWWHGRWSGGVLLLLPLLLPLLLLTALLHMSSLQLF